MKPASILLGIGLSMLTAGCSDSSAPADATAPAAISDPTAVNQPAPAVPPVIDGHELERAIQDPLQRARSVEGEVMKAADDADKELEDQGG